LSSRSSLAQPVSRSMFTRARDALHGPQGWLDTLFVPFVVAALCVYLTTTTDVFFTQTNLTNILQQASVLAIVAFGTTFVILAGELDLSIGSGVALVSVIGAYVMKHTGSIPVGVLAGIGAGAVLGLANGVIVTRLEVPSFIATLGTMIIAHGIALAITNGGVVYGLPDGVGALANNTFLGIQWVSWLMFGVFAVLYLVQRITTFGIRVFAVGGNREAARLSGIPVMRIILLCFVLGGLTIGIAGIALMSRVESGQPNAESLLGLEAIAAIVVGGTSLLGGRGSVARTLWGVLLIAVLDNGLDLKGVNDDVKQIVIGCVFIGAASVDFFRRQLRRRRSAARFIPETAPAEPTPQLDLTRKSARR
jgi:ribose/xylose/arabinose/galactoside ABC-type transport system permease subunit